MILSRDRLALPRRRWLLSAAALPAALLLPGCARRPGGVGSLQAGRAGARAGAAPPAAGRRADRATSGGTTSIQTPVVSPDGTLIAACEAPDRSQLDLAGTAAAAVGHEHRGDRAPAEPSRHQAAGLAPNGSRLAVGDALHVAEVDVEGTLLRNLVGNADPRGTAARILDVAYSPDGSLLAASASDGAVRLYSTSTDSCTGTGPRPGRLAGRGPWRSRPTAPASPSAASLLTDADEGGRPTGLWDRTAAGGGPRRCRDGARARVRLGTAHWSKCLTTHPRSPCTRTDRRHGPAGGRGTVQGSGRRHGDPGSQCSVRRAPSSCGIVTATSRRRSRCRFWRICWSPDEATLYTLSESEDLGVGRDCSGGSSSCRGPDGPGRRAGEAEHGERSPSPSPRSAHNVPRHDDQPRSRARTTAHVG